jgi:hypothetical protein
MPRTRNDSCSSCGKPVYRGPTSLPEIICRECRRKHPQSKYLPRPCDQCGVIFQPKSKAKGRPPQRFCSLNCAAQSNQRKRWGSNTKYRRNGRRLTAAESEHVRMKSLNWARKRRRRLNAAPWDGVLDSAILERDRWMCRAETCLYPSRRISKTRKYPDPRSPSIDHILPLSLGGDDTQYNKRASHFGCNMARGNTPDEQMPLPFGADMDSTNRFYVRTSRSYRDCQICGQRVPRTQPCKLHKPLIWCRYCKQVIPNAGINRVLHPSCKQAELADAAGHQHVRTEARCRAVGCDAPGTFGGGCCAPHYHRLKRYGDVFAGIPLARTREERWTVACLVRDAASQIGHNRSNSAKAGQTG